MIYFITKYGPSKLPLLYTDKELLQLVESYIQNVKSYFRYSNICNFIEDKALQEEKFQVEPYTRYVDIIISEQDHHRINMILWQMIWRKKIAIEFNNMFSNNNDTMFSVVEDKWQEGGEK